VRPTDFFDTAECPYPSSQVSATDEGSERTRAGVCTSCGVGTRGNRWGMLSISLRRVRCNVVAGEHRAVLPKLLMRAVTCRDVKRRCRRCMQRRHLMKQLRLRARHSSTTKLAPGLCTVPCKHAPCVERCCPAHMPRSERERIWHAISTNSCFPTLYGQSRASQAAVSNAGVKLAAMCMVACTQVGARTQL
jgi:hypothetical protein